MQTVCLLSKPFVFHQTKYPNTTQLLKIFPSKAEKTKHKLRALRHTLEIFPIHSYRLKTTGVFILLVFLGATNALQYADAHAPKSIYSQDNLW